MPEYPAMTAGTSQAAPPPSPEDLWRQNEQLIRSFLKKVLYLCPDHISKKEFFDSTFSQVYRNFTTRCHTFDGRNWEGWLYMLVRNTARPGSFDR